MTPKQQPIRMLDRRLSSDSACNLATLNRYYLILSMLQNKVQGEARRWRWRRWAATIYFSFQRWRRSYVRPQRTSGQSIGTLNVLSSSFDGNTSDDTHVSVAIDVSNNKSPPKIDHIMLRKKWGISPAKARAERATRNGIIRTAMVLFFVTVWIFAILNVISLATIGERGFVLGNFILDLLW